MSLTIEDANFISATRMKMIENHKKGLPPEHDIDREALKLALDKVRKNRSLGDATGSKAKAKAPIIPLDLSEWANRTTTEKNK